jgi:ubiquinone/menaquinone biosynthesis C-methylase UbiE
VGLDAGCGSGRWATEVARPVTHLHVLDSSADAFGVARRNRAEFRNVTFHLASIDEIPLPARSLDFAFSLGVLHHVQLPTI